MSILTSNIFKRSVTSVALLTVLGGCYLHSTVLFIFFLIAVLVIAVIFEWSFLISDYSFYSKFIITLLYPVLPIVLLMLLVIMFKEQHMFFPLYPYIIAWVGDTSGYIVGKQIGKHKLASDLSPGKTYEGLIGSLIGVFFANYIIFQYVPIMPFIYFASHMIILFVYSLAITLIGLFGGLFISYFKRRKGVKDAGIILPGHGGILDRFDSVFFIIIFIWIIFLGYYFIFLEKALLKI